MVPARNRQGILRRQSTQTPVTMKGTGGSGVDMNLHKQATEELSNARNPQYGQDTTGDETLMRKPPQMRPYIKNWQDQADRANAKAK